MSCNCVHQLSAEEGCAALQKPEHAGRLTVVLDLDGTLLSSFTPRRAPVLPPGSTAYVVGRGGRLNPSGVFVVERPGLTHFFDHLCKFAGALLCMGLTSMIICASLLVRTRTWASPTSSITSASLLVRTCRQAADRLHHGRALLGILGAKPCEPSSAPSSSNVRPDASICTVAL